MIIKFDRKAQQKHRPTTLLHHAGKMCILYVVLFPVLYFFVDKPLALYFRTISSDAKHFFTFISTLIDPYYYYILLPVLYFLIRVVMRKEQIGNRLLLLVLSIPLANIVTNVAKMVFGRDRPELLFFQDAYGFHFLSDSNTEFSFPSGHATTIGAFTASIACFYPKYSWQLFCIGILFSFCRVVLSYHYLSDVLAGVLIGTIIAQGAYIAMKKENLFV